MVYQQDSPAAMNSKSSTTKFRARIIVLVSCMEKFAYRFFIGCPRARDEDAAKKPSIGLMTMVCQGGGRGAGLVEPFRIFGHCACLSHGMWRNFFEADLCLISQVLAPYYGEM